MTAADLVPLLTGGGIAAVVIAVIGAFAGRKKLSAEATEIIQKTTSEAVRLAWESENRLREQALVEAKAAREKIEGLTARVATLEKRDAEHEHERSRLNSMVLEWLASAQIHAAYDHLVLEALREAGLGDEFGEMPPLIPPGVIEHARLVRQTQSARRQE